VAVLRFRRRLLTYLLTCLQLAAFSSDPTVQAVVSSVNGRPSRLHYLTQYLPTCVTNEHRESPTTYAYQSFAGDGREMYSDKKTDDDNLSRRTAPPVASGSLGFPSTGWLPSGAAYQICTFQQDLLSDSCRDVRTFYQPRMWRENVRSRTCLSLCVFVCNTLTFVNLDIERGAC